MKHILTIFTLPLLCLPIASADEADANREKSKSPVTFSEHVAPIMFNNCMSCHRKGEAAPFALTKFSEVRKRGKLIVEVTEDRYMPPWHADPSDYEFKDVRRLSDSDIATLKKWVETGMKEGDASKLPESPKFVDGWQLGKPDVIATTAEKFTVPDEGPDIYRNFSVPLDHDEDIWVKAIELRPSSPEVVHHSLFFLDKDRFGRREEAKGGRPGFSRMGRLFTEDASMGGWAVGANPIFLPEGLAYKVPKGADIVLSTHFHPTGKEQDEQSTIGLHLSKEPPKRGFTTIQLPPLFGALSQVNIPAGEANYTKTDSFKLPVDVKAFGISAHAHQIGKKMLMTATFPDGKTKTLLKIDDWDFNWQEQYTFKEHVDLPADTVIKSKVVWDNSAENPRNPNNPPKSIKWGRETKDEMGSLTLSVFPTDNSTLSELKQAYQKHVRDYGIQSFTGLTLGEGQAGQLEKMVRGMVKQYDKDGDGDLNEEEQAAMRKAVEKMFQGFGGGGRGRNRDR